MNKFFIARRNLGDNEYYYVFYLHTQVHDFHEILAKKSRVENAMLKTNKQRSLNNRSIPPQVLFYAFAFR
jgi:hypothetical protein